jgi:hypothetical protein
MVLNKALALERKAFLLIEIAIHKSIFLYVSAVLFRVGFPQVLVRSHGRFNSSLHIK